MTPRPIHRLVTVLIAALALAVPAGAAAAQEEASTGIAAVQEDPFLSIGDVGPAVERWQDRLNAWLESTAPERAQLAVDGIFGPRTQAATRDFQQNQGITVDGIVGPETRAAMSATSEAGDSRLRAQDVLSPAIDTSEDTGEPSAPSVAVTDVRVGTHDGFDRVVFDIGGEGQIGWQVRYVDEARAQGSGNPIDVAGDAVLAVSLQNVAYPTDRPPGVEGWDGPERIAIGDSGPALELVEDTIFEGIHTFFVGITGEQPFQVRRFQSPQRVVLDVAGSEGSAPPDQGAPSPDDELPGGELARCENPEGFTIARPQSWHTNDGEVVSPCSQFHPEPFTVPAGTDERVAAITAYIDPVPFHEVTTLDAAREGERAATTIDGLQAVRLAYVSDDDALWPAGTPITRYAIDLSPGVDEGPGTLFLDTIGLPDFDYGANQVILDRMARSVEVTRDDVPTEPSVVARYEGGGGAFSVAGDVSGNEACLRIPPGGEPVCAQVPRNDQLRTIQLQDLQPVLGGVAGPDVFTVTAERQDGSTSTVLPAPIGASEARGFAFTFGIDEVIGLRTFDVTGAQLQTLPLGG